MGVPYVGALRVQARVAPPRVAAISITLLEWQVAIVSGLYPAARANVVPANVAAHHWLP
jgi:hypothetical protein